jgi:hypothetical protein
MTKGGTTMTTEQGMRRMQGLAAALLLTAAGAGAQVPAPVSPIGRFSMQDTVMIAVLVAAVAAMIVYLVLTLGRREPTPTVPSVYNEPEPASSKYEQLMAEIQGLSLRVQGGESKGSYRKIEQLVRVYLERSGHPAARQMSDEQIRKILEGGSVPHSQGQALLAIFERCKQGAQHEGEKLDFNAGELLKTLRALVIDADEQAPPPVKAA